MLDKTDGHLVKKFYIGKTLKCNAYFYTFQ